MGNPLRAAVHARHDDFRWEGIDLLPYKEDGSAPFRAITRQTLVNSDDLHCELRYFEVGPGGYSTLERHEHAHAVVILRGHGRCLLGEQVHEIGANDLVTIPGRTWHQFRAAGEEPLGFLCIVNVERDRPQLPAEADLCRLRANPLVAAFLEDNHDST